MSKKTKNDRKTYAMQCSGCKKIVLPPTQTERKELEELAMVDDLIKNWASGKINIFSEMPNSVRQFIEESIRSAIESRALDVLLAYRICNCADSSCGVIKCLTMQEPPEARSPQGSV